CLVPAPPALPRSPVLARLSSVAFWIVLAGVMVPFRVAPVPLYQTMRDLGLLGSLPSLILFYIGSQVPFSVFLYTGFLRTLERDYEEAAAIDGAGPLRTFVASVFPLLRPSTGTVGILHAGAAWNGCLLPRRYVS